MSFEMVAGSLRVDVTLFIATTLYPHLQVHDISRRWSTEGLTNSDILSLAHVWALKWRQAHSVLMWFCLSRLLLKDIGPLRSNNPDIWFLAPYFIIHAHVWALKWRQAHSVLMWLCLSRHFILSSGQCEHMFSRLLSCSNAAAAAPIDQGMDLKWCLKKDLEFHSKLGACDWGPLGL